LSYASRPRTGAPRRGAETRQQLMKALILHEQALGCGFGRESVRDDDASARQAALPLSVREGRGNSAPLSKDAERGHPSRCSRGNGLRAARRDGGRGTRKDVGGSARSWGFQDRYPSEARPSQHTFEIWSLPMKAEPKASSSLSPWRPDRRALPGAPRACAATGRSRGPRRRSLDRSFAWPPPLSGPSSSVRPCARTS